MHSHTPIGVYQQLSNANCNRGAGPLDRPPLLYQINAPPTARADEVGVPWIDRGCQVVDECGQPLRCYSALPDTIASSAAGWEIEAWSRSTNRIGLNDIAGRMPRGRHPSKSEASAIQGKLREACIIDVLCCADSVSS